MSSFSINNRLLEINGTSKNDNIRVIHHDNNQLEVKVNNESQIYDATLVDHINIHGYAGNDDIRVEDQRTGGALTTINMSIDGGDGDDKVFSGGGNDIISGGKGKDELYGGEGNDVIKGDEGDDYIDGEKGMDILTGGEGNDAITVGPDTYDSMDDTITDLK
jgi:Ca2+-binding RTX toxin-like protein